MTESDFRSLAARGFNRIPLTVETFADLDTPLSVYLKFGAAPHTFLFESVQGGERFGRFSFIGLPTGNRIEVRGRECTEYRDGAVATRREVDDPLGFVAEYRARFNAFVPEGLPRFCGGLVGYFGYDCVRHFERRLSGTSKADPIDTPDIVLLAVTEVAVVDNLKGKLYFVCYVDPAEPDAYARGRARLAELVQRLRRPVTIPAERPQPLAAPSCEFAREDFMAAVERAKRYIVDGDIMQVVLSQRMSQPFAASPLALYRALRALNPSPYMFYLDFGDYQVVGASPEILVRLEGDTVTVRPIAGTRPRGGSREEDARLADELLSDPKERAEHIMLMDLGRNDVGRIAQLGTVHVTENMGIEHYSHVMHIVSNVEGKLRSGLGAMDVLRATFPAGTVSGAPKVRAMEIIDELEPTKRGVYAGAVGYLAFSGDMDVAIAIRTGLVKAGRLLVQAGAGIVADSVPASEWTETENKARALLRAAEMAQSGLDTRFD